MRIAILRSHGNFMHYNKFDNSGNDSDNRFYNNNNVYDNGYDK